MGAVGGINAHQISIVVTGTDESKPALASAAASHERLVNEVVTGGQRMARAMQGTGASVVQLDQRFKEWERTARRQAELAAELTAVPKSALGGANVKSLSYDIVNAKDEADIDRVGMKIGLLTQKAEMLGALGGAGMKKFGAEIRAATNTTQLDAIALKIKAAGDAAQGASHKFTTMHGAVKTLSDKFAALAPGVQSFLGMFAGMAAFQGVMSIVEAMKELVMGTKELALEQRKINIESMEAGLSVETLETYKVAAAETGVELGSLRMGMRMLVTNMEKNPKAFEELGISVRDNVTGRFKELDEVMPQIMDLFQGMTSKTDQLAMASTIFGGRMGARLIPLLVQGSDAMRGYYEEGVKMGVIMDAVSDKNLTDLAKKIAISDLAMEGMKKQLQLGLVPAFEAWAVALLKAITALEWLATHGMGFKEKSRDDAALKAGGVRALPYMSGPLSAPFGAPGDSSNVGGFWTTRESKLRILNPMEPLESGAKAAENAVTELTKAYDAFLDKMKKGETEAKQDKRAKDIAELARAMGVGTVEAKKMYEQMAALDALDFRDSTIKKVEQYALRMRSVAEETRLAVDALTQFYALGADGKPLMPRGESSWGDRKTMTAALMVGVNRDAKGEKGAGKGFKDADTEDKDETLVEYMRKMRTASEDALSVANMTRDGLSAIFSGLSSGLAATMEEMIRGTMNLKQGLDTIWRSILSAFFDMISQMIARALVLAAIKMMLGIPTVPIPSGWGDTSGPALSPRSLSPAGSSTNAMGGTATVNNVTIQTFSPRDVLMQYTSPSGVLRNAQARLVLQGEM